MRLRGSELRKWPSAEFFRILLRHSGEKAPPFGIVCWDALHAEDVMFAFELVDTSLLAA
jgi:hypothetical protein